MVDFTQDFAESARDFGNSAESLKIDCHESQGDSHNDDSVVDSTQK